MQKIRDNKILKFIWKTIKIISTIYIVFIIGIIIIQRVFNNNVSIFGYRIFTVATGSMEPEYKVLDIIFVRQTKIEEIKIGDDLVYLGETGDFNGKIITHRVIKIDTVENQTVFHTKGIANPIEDPVVKENQIFGKVLFKGVVLSLINKVINNPIGFYILIIIPVASLIFLEIIDRKKEKEVVEEKNEQE